MRARARAVAEPAAIVVRLAVFTVLALTWSAVSADQPHSSPPGLKVRPTPRSQQAAKPRKSPAAKYAEPWPDDATIAARRADAEGRRLFQSADTLQLTLTADFAAVNGDRSRNSTRTFPASITVAAAGGGDVRVPVTLGTRGKIRLDVRVCGFPPLRVDFAKKGVEGTPFEGQRTLKLVTHCQDGELFDQYILKEYLAYRLFNLVTTRSFRTRLSKITYVNAKNSKRMFTHYAVFVEDDDDLARRLDGRVLEFPHTAFKDYDRDALATLMVFQYMIGNTDFSLWALHNAKMVQTRYRPLYPITWDFDASGLVDPYYVMPDPQLKIGGFDERVYRGPCRTLEGFEPIFAAFRAKQAESLALVDSLPDLSEGNRKAARRFLEDFYRTLGRKDALKKEFVDKCNPKNNTM